MKTQMRLWMALASISVASVATAATKPLADNAQNCRLVSGKGPYKGFRITYEIIDGKPTGEVTLKLTYKSEDYVGDTKTKTFRTKDDVGPSADGLSAEIVGRYGHGVKLGVSDSDFSSASIELGDDDDGVSAFVDFSSDGPAVRGFYLCTPYPVALQKYMENDHPTLARPGRDRDIEDIVEEVVYTWSPSLEGSSSRSVTYSTVAVAEGSPQIVTAVVVEEGLLDDSVTAQRTTLTIDREKALVIEKKVEYRCQPGRGQQDWGTKLCL